MAADGLIKSVMLNSPIVCAEQSAHSGRLGTIGNKVFCSGKEHVNTPSHMGATSGELWNNFANSVA